MLNQFTKHPASIDKSYLQHMRIALFFFSRFCLGAAVSLVHAFLPFLFEETGSELVNGLHEKMMANSNSKGNSSP